METWSWSSWSQKCFCFSSYCRTISMQAILIILRQSLSLLPHHWLTPSEIYLMMDKPCLHTLPLFSSITGRRHSRFVRWHKFVVLQQRGGAYFSMCGRSYNWVLFSVPESDSPNAHVNVVSSNPAKTRHTCYTIMW